MKKVWNANLGNYYGEIELEFCDDAYQLRLGNWDGFSYVMVSDEFAKAFIAEFECNGVKETKDE